MDRNIRRSDEGDQVTICTNSLYEASHELFDGYPLATRTVNRSGSVRSMVLMLQEGDVDGFFVLSQDYGDAKPTDSGSGHGLPETSWTSKPRAAPTSPT